MCVNKKKIIMCVYIYLFLMNEISCKFVYYFFLHFLFCAIDRSLLSLIFYQRGNILLQQYLDNFYNLIISCLFTIQMHLLKLLSILIKKANRWRHRYEIYKKIVFRLISMQVLKNISLAAQNADGSLFQFFFFLHSSPNFFFFSPQLVHNKNRYIFFSFEYIIIFLRNIT